MMPRTITLEEATKIAGEYCAKNHPNRRSVFRGMFEGKYLFCCHFPHSGHFGMPIFVVISTRSGGIVTLERHSDVYNRAWTFSDNWD